MFSQGLISGFGGNIIYELKCLKCRFGDCGNERFIDLMLDRAGTFLCDFRGDGIFFFIDVVGDIRMYDI